MEIWSAFEELKNDPQSKAFSEEDFVNVLPSLNEVPNTLKLNLIEENSRVPLDAAQAVIRNRAGAVLGRGSILKSDHFPGTIISNSLSLYSGIIIRNGRKKSEKRKGTTIVKLSFSHFEL